MFVNEVPVEKIKDFSDLELVESTNHFVKAEREILTSILHHFKEIERRRLFCDYHFKSLHEMAIKYFKYSDDQAYRRIAAARLLAEMPELKEKIDSGDLSLTNLNIAQSHFRQEKKSGNELNKEQKQTVLDELCGKSTRQAESIVMNLSSQPEQLKPDKIAQVSASKIEIKFTASLELRDKIEHLKGIKAHTNPNIQLGELFEELCDLALKQWDPAAASRKQRATVFTKANSKCENCGSTYALETDHIKPKGIGGSNKPENLRSLCRACNQRAAIKTYGQQKMNRHIN